MSSSEKAARTKKSQKAIYFNVMAKSNKRRITTFMYGSNFAKPRFRPILCGKPAEKEEEKKREREEQQEQRQGRESRHEDMSAQQARRPAEEPSSAQRQHCGPEEKRMMRNK